MATGQVLVQDISPWYVGQLSPLWQFTIMANGAPVNLTGGTSPKVLFALAGAPAAAGAGVATITNPTGGVVTYQLAAADVTSPGLYRVYVEVQMPNGPLISDPVDWQLEPLD